MWVNRRMNRLPPVILHKLINESSIDEEVLRLEQDLSDANQTIGILKSRLSRVPGSDVTREFLRRAEEIKRQIEADLLSLRKHGRLGLVSRELNDMVNEGQSNVPINQKRIRKRKMTGSKRRRVTKKSRRRRRRTRSRRRTRR